jgi:hypothetical protein
MGEILPPTCWRFFNVLVGGSVLCYVAYTIEYSKNPDVLGDNVSDLPEINPQG